MELRGSKLKEYRQKKEMSQADLAKDICTQATVSLMENKNKLPGMPILFAICESLGIQVEDLVTEDNRNLGDIFSQINQHLLEQDYEAAERELNQIRIKQIRTSFDKQRYYYFIGVIQLQVSQDLNEAMFNFQLSIQEFAEQETNMYKVLTTIEMGKVYLAQKNEKLAGQLAIQAQTMVKDEQLGGSIQQYIYVNVNLSKLALESNQILISLEAATDALTACREHGLLLALDEIYLSLALGNHALGKIKEAKKQIIIAKAVNEVLQNDRLTQQISQENTKLGK
ncbi:helix-turn-helix transcriptional regulator [Paucilactobacillus nenjiangensis]|uniref:helix-turn-helix transcriptional regulator n=1 Tax=Paucilactobacillus nenjiangensis TaxID=1296540 RepID=UPI0010FA1265|nr:helix-turn-helix transcriptional regulator [Paucilactobacillus nenjiangensis]